MKNGDISQALKALNELAEVTLAILKAAVNIPDGLYARAQYLAKKELATPPDDVRAVVDEPVACRLAAKGGES